MSGRGRNRPDSRQMWDESDRRNRGTRDRNGDYDRNRDRDRDRYREERPRDRDRQHRDRSRSPRRDRRDRHRSRSPRRDRDRDDDRDQRRDHDRRETRRDDRGEDRRQGRFREEDGRVRHSNPKRSVSPSRDPSDKDGRDSHDSPLPRRPKDSAKSSAPSLSFKVGKQEDGSSRKSRERDGLGSHQDTPDGEHRRGRTEERTNRTHSDAEAMDEDEDDMVVEDDAMNAMQAMMGFGGFGTTKGTKVVGNNVGGVRKEKKTEYRQYMNRVGGFNRPLSPGR
ncbi:hypothetical protein F5Y15DRAFT_374167 [Xylariaceae sp. FL0016]|nr:hypothetical protein F5Y15DRAFT_374167 [Xylariaceae sp. FL0016]